MTINDIFSLASKYDEDKVKFNSKTVDRKGGDCFVTIIYDGKKFTSSDELYNYITNKNKSLRDYSDNTEFKETELEIIKTHKDNASDIISTKLKFKIGYVEDTLIITKEVN